MTRVLHVHIVLGDKAKAPEVLAAIKSVLKSPTRVASSIVKGEREEPDETS